MRGASKNKQFHYQNAHNTGRRNKNTPERDLIFLKENDLTFEMEFIERKKKHIKTLRYNSDSFINLKICIAYFFR